MTEGAGESQPSGVRPYEEHGKTGTPVKPSGWHEGSQPAVPPSGVRPYEEHGKTGTPVKPSGWHEGK